MMKMNEKVPYLPSYPALRGILLYPSEWLSNGLHQVHPCACQDPRLLEENAQELSLVIEGKPIPKARARTVNRGNIIATYDPQEKEKVLFRQKLKMELAKYPNIEMEASRIELDRRYWVDLTFGMELAASSTYAQKNAKLWHIDFHRSKPDLDNLEKFVLDCGNGILFPDDSMIVRLSSRKVYSNNPKTIIKITMFEKRDLHKSAEKIITLFTPHDFVGLCHDMRTFMLLADEMMYSDTEPKSEAFELCAYYLKQILNRKELAKVAKIDYSLTHAEISAKKEKLHGFR